MIFWTDMLFVNKLFNQGYVGPRLNSSLRNDTIIIMNCMTGYRIFISQMAMDLFPFTYILCPLLPTRLLPGLTMWFFLLICLMVFNATFNNMSVISWRSALLVEETGGPGENHRFVSDKLYHIMLCTSPWPRFELTTSGVIGDKSNYHTIMATTAPLNYLREWMLVSFFLVIIGLLTIDV